MRLVSVIGVKVNARSYFDLIIVFILLYCFLESACVWIPHLHKLFLISLRDPIGFYNWYQSQETKSWFGFDIIGFKKALIGTDLVC